MMGHHSGGLRYVELLAEEAPADQLNTPACAWVGMICKAVVRADENGVLLYSAA